MYLYSVKSTEPVRSIDIKDAKAVPGQIRTNQELTADSHQKIKGEKLVEFRSILAQHDISMNFSTNEQTNDVVVKLVDVKTGETIRQIPNEVSLKLAAANIKLQGLMVDETV
jgi:flagellar protein FlaG